MDKTTTGIPKPNLRRTQYLTGSLLAGSRNVFRTASRTASVDFLLAQLVGKLNREEIIKRICGEESVDLKKRVKFLQDHLEEDITRKPELEEEFKKIHEELTVIKKYLSEKIPSPIESVIEAIKYFHSDFNAIQENDSELQQNRNLDAEPKKNIDFNTARGQDDEAQLLLLPSQRTSMVNRDT